MGILRHAFWTITYTIVLGLTISGCQHSGDPVVEGSFPLEEKWYFEADGDVVTEPAIGNGRIAIRTRREIYMLDAHTGLLIWAAELPLEIFDVSPTPLLIGNDEVIVGYQDGVQALKTETGQMIWKSHETDCVGAGAFPTALSETLVYVVRHNCHAKAYDRMTGAVIWNVPLGGRGGANLFLDQNKVYLVGPNRILRVLDAATGTRIEEIKEQVDFPATYQSGILYGFKDDELVAFDTRIEKLLWKNQGMKSMDPPAVMGQSVLAPAYNGYPMALDAQTGRLLWTAKTDQGRYQTPAILEDTIYIREIFTGKIYALALQNGADRGHLLTGNRLVISDWSYTWRPVTIEGLLIVTMGRKVYAYGN